MMKMASRRSFANLERVVCLTLLAGALGASSWAAPLVSNVKTALVIRTRKRLPGVPIEEEPDDHDEEHSAA